MTQIGGRLQKPVPVFRLEKEPQPNGWGLVLIAAGKVVKGLAWLVFLMLRYPVSTAVFAVLGYVYWRWGEGGLSLVTSLLVVVAALWAWLAGTSFAAWCAIPWRSRLRMFWVYRRQWEPAMAMCGLSVSFAGDEYVPVLRRVIADGSTDRVLIRLQKGQAPSHVEAVTDELAHAFGAIKCQVIAEKPGRVWLVFTGKDRLAEAVPALPVQASVDLAAVPVGLRQDVLAYPRRLDPIRRRIDGVLDAASRWYRLLLGLRLAGASGSGTPTWTLRLLGTHLLLAGATGAGKSGLLWSLIRALIPGIRSGLVELWVVDPKGGMEFAFGTPLFARYCWGDDRTADTEKKRAFEVGYAEFLEHAVAEMRRRQGYLRGRTRLHQPVPGEPLIVIVIDELASLTAYVVDREAKKRIDTALQLLLSQGRAVGISLVAAVQDPRKEVLSYRGLFPARIAFRLAEEEETDLVLGRAARKRGAARHEIPDTAPGVAYLVLDGVREPARVRAGHVTDADITAMATNAAEDGVVRPFPGPGPDGEGRAA